VFTSDYKDRWGVAWTGWPGAARLFAQLGRDITRRADDPRVRLDAEAAGGELHLRAAVVDDDGRTESFRRLVARVGGPDGFRRDVPLEAVGAGAYAATVPLSRPGAFIVTAVDETTNEPVATTGAVLTAGEELRPTGTDRALLSRLATLTGGKMRDTLAGVFRDRDERRFAYRSITAPLLLLTALALLLSVAARRLMLPEALTRFLTRRRTGLRRSREPHPTGPGAAPVQAASTAETLLAAKQRAAEARASPPSVPRFGRAPPIASITRPPTVAVPPPVPRAGLEPPPSRPLSTAELLLARRKGRK
jgi:hypothetical protein